MEPLLAIDNLHVKYGDTPVLRGISLALQAGEILGIVGESGSGKSTTIHSIMGILDNTAQIADGSIVYNKKNLVKLKQREMRQLRGKELALVSQNPLDAFYPTRTIKSQLHELARTHGNIGKREAEERMLALLDSMNLKDGKKLLASYSFEMSGGICQRVSIAMSMVLQPKLLLADEPTSALDVTVQAQVVKELMRTREIFGTSILIVSHNMGVIAHMADQIAVMHEGLILEYGEKRRIISNPAHPYTKNLIKAIPKLGAPAPRGIHEYKFNHVTEACMESCNCFKTASQSDKRFGSMIEIEDGHWVMPTCKHK